METNTLPIFHSRKDKQTFAQWHTINKFPLDANNQSYSIYMEKSLRASMKIGTVIGWHIEYMTDDYNGISKYMNGKSYAIIEYDNKTEQWPLTMLYFDI